MAQETPFKYLNPRTVEAVKRLSDLAFNKPAGPDPDCPYCITTGDADPQVAAEKICDPAGPEKDKCVSILKGLGHIEDRKAWDPVAARLQEVTPGSPMTDAFLAHARRIWWHESPPPPKKEAADTGGGGLLHPKRAPIPSLPPSPVPAADDATV